MNSYAGAMQFELLLPTSGPSELFWNLLHCVSTQTVMPTRITVLWHKQVTQEEHDAFKLMLVQKLKNSITSSQEPVAIELITNISFPDYQPGRGVWYDRDFLLQQASEDFCYMIDQDNEFEWDHFESMVAEYQKIQKEQEIQKEKRILLSPTIEWRKSGKIQSRWIVGMYYLFPKYIFNKNTDRHGFSQVQMIGGNSLFGPRKMMQEIGFDTKMKRCYEDIDFSYRFTLAGGKIFVLHEVRIHHMEKDQTPLSSRFLHRPEVAYARSNNCIRFVKKTAWFVNKWAYLLCGVWVQTAFFLYLCMRYGGPQRVELVRAVCRGVIAF